MNIINPYESIDWHNCEYIHSMSHQHSLADDFECEAFYKMGYGHFAFSNYYPSKPIVKLPDNFIKYHPDIILSPNAEHHSFIDTSLHANGLGSFTSSGYGQSAGKNRLEKSPIVISFDSLNTYSEYNNLANIYRLDIYVKPKDNEKVKNAAELTVNGGVELIDCDNLYSSKKIIQHPIDSGKQSLRFKVNKPSITATLNYNPNIVDITRFSLMQGANRPWRDVFKFVLDGQIIKGDKIGGLKYHNGGGITLNHPVEEYTHYLPMLDFDSRVLGIEVWNYKRGFGENLHYYKVWDNILKTGRKCWSFFVKDHRAYQRGRNVLLTPSTKGLSCEEKEKMVLCAYRNGSFFGSIGSHRLSNNNKIDKSFDKSNFKFTDIKIEKKNNSNTLIIKVRVDGQDVNRLPNIQIRFITALGICKIINTSDGYISLSINKLSQLKYLRIEAFAYPDTHKDGIKLNSKTFSNMDVGQIAALRSSMSIKESINIDSVSSWNSIRHPTIYKDSIPAVDMIFSQPIYLTSTVY